MKCAYGLAVASVLGAATWAVAGTVTVGVREQGTGATNVTVAPGETVDYEIFATLSTDNDGLAFISVDLNATSGLALVPVDPPASGVMDSFVRPDGYDGGPLQPGYEGTLIGNSLVQIGGAQNTIGHTGTYPLGSVVLDVGHGGVVVAEGSVTAPGAQGAYTLNISDIICNAITSGPDVVAVEAVTGTVGTSLIINVEANVTPAMVQVASINTHGSAGALPIAVDTTASLGSTGSASVTTETRIGGINLIEITFAAPLHTSVGGLGSAAVSITSNPAGAVIPSIATSLADSDTTLVLDFTGLLPDKFVYTFTLGSGVVAAGPATPATDLNFEFRSLMGNVCSADPGPQVVNAIDLGLGCGVRGHFGLPVATPDNTPRDVDMSGSINALDFGCIKLTCGVFGNTAP